MDIKYHNWKFDITGEVLKGHLHIHRGDHFYINWYLI